MRSKDCPQMEKMCRNCEHAVRIEGSEMCVCNKKGIVGSKDKCGSFKADLLKYEPSRPKIPAISETE